MEKLTNKNQTSHHSRHITQKGITLVALVITIIVLLILAGVAINMAIDSDGLFGKANEATEKWNESVEKEETAIGDLLTELDKVSPMEVEISTDIPEGWDANKVSAVATAGSRKAPIPVGFTVSSIEGENTIGKGLVIYQTRDANISEDFWTEKDENNNYYLKCQTQYNQFVWIPVDDINYMVMCKENSSTNVCNVVLQQDGILKCEKHDSEDLCSRVYEVGTGDNMVEETHAQIIDKEKWQEQIYSDFKYAEPEILVYYDTTDSNLTGIGLSSTDDKTVQEVFLAQLKKDFTEMAASVAKYGGFYVSRYEAQSDGASLRNKVVLVAGETEKNDSVPDTYTNGGAWYGLYNTLRNSASINNPAVKSHMMWRKSV